MDSFYENYISLCAKNKKSPSAVAESIGLSRTAVNGWKNGKTPSDATKQRIADHFCVSVDTLMGNKNPPAVQWDSEGDPVQAELNRRIIKMSPEQKRKTLDIIRVLMEDEENG